MARNRDHKLHIARRRSTQTPSTFAAYDLPPDVLVKSARRIGFLGLILAVTAPLSYIAEYYLQPARVVLPGRVPLPQVAAILLFVTGMVTFVAAWSRRVAPRTIVDLGLIFEVVGAFGISLSEHAAPWPPDVLIRGVTWNALWIAVFAAAVPASFGKMALASVTAAMMGPIGFATATLVNGNPVPATNQLVLILLPNFVAAGWAIPASRHLHSLGAQVSKAREMGSYKLVEPIGRGGMGEVWRAEHRMLARAAAIKLIRPEVLSADDVMLRRFEREARAIAALRSPHTVALYDFGTTEEGRFYYVMELLEGLDLEALVERFGPVPPARAAYVLKQVCKSLAEAHERGLVHRDIKPRNLFVCRLGTEFDFAKVLDFGLVKNVLDVGETLTQLTAGVVTGTPAYMAPEAATTVNGVDGRADLYALGCVAHWLLTGHTLFTRDSAMAMLLAHVQEQPQAPSSRSPHEVPPSLDRVIMRCLEKDPARRPASALELYALLEETDCGQPWTSATAAEWWRRHLGDTEFLAVGAELGPA